MAAPARMAPDPRAFEVLVMCTGALFAGWLASRVGIRAPWFFGAMVGSFLAARILPAQRRRHAILPRPVVMAFVAVITVIFGGRISADLSPEFLTWWSSILLVTIYVFVAQFAGYWFFLRIGRFDRVTAWFAASPGGLVESSAQSDADQGDRPMITLMLFLRIVVIMFALPLIYSVWFGRAPGSAAQMFADRSPADMRESFIIIALAAAGFIMARVIPIPGLGLIGPFFIGIAAGLFGLMSGAIPPIAIIAVQLVIGASLGSNFAVLPAHRAARALPLALAHAVMVMTIALIFAGLMLATSDVPIWLGILILAPAGIAEMGVIALSLGANPTQVIVHHIWRIGVTLIGFPIWLGLWRGIEARFGLNLRTWKEHPNPHPRTGTDPET